MKKRISIVFLMMAGLMMTAANPAAAAVITHWDMNNVTVTPPPYTQYQTYRSYLFSDAGKTSITGEIIWKETDHQAPGMKIVNGDDQTGENCIMASGYNPEDGTDKMCSDPFQTSKRWKLRFLEHTPLDVYFAVSGNTKATTYRSLQKLSNLTSTRLQGFTVELGFMVNGQFVKSTTGDGLGFSDRRGRVFTRPVAYDPKNANNLSAFFPHEMAGAPDDHHDEPGYFYPEERMYIDLIATEDEIVSTGISQNHLDLLGYWHYAADVPWGIRFDDDWDVNTDNILVAHCDGEFDEQALQCLGEWVTYRSCIGLDAHGEPCDSDGIRKPVPQATIDAWLADPQFLLDEVDDLANLSVNYHITVADNRQWPTPNQFVARFTPIPVDGDPVTPSPPSIQADVAIDGITVPRTKPGQTRDIVVGLSNKLAGEASGILELKITDQNGSVINVFTTDFATWTDSTSRNYKFTWTAPNYRTSVTITATALNVVGEINPADNSLSVNLDVR